MCGWVSGGVGLWGGVSVVVGVCVWVGGKCVGGSVGVYVSVSVCVWGCGWFLWVLMGGCTVLLECYCDVCLFVVCVVGYGLHCYFVSCGCC